MTDTEILDWLEANLGDSFIHLDAEAGWSLTFRDTRGEPPYRTFIQVEGQAPDYSIRSLVKQAKAILESPA